MQNPRRVECIASEQRHGRGESNQRHTARIRVPRGFFAHLQAAKIVTVKPGLVSYDAAARRHWGYLCREIETHWLYAAHCWGDEYAEDEPPSAAHIRDHEPDGWLVHVYVAVLGEDARAIESTELQALIETHTSIADPSLLDRSMLGVDH